MASIYRWYNRLLENHLMKVQCLQTGFLMALGDLLSQVFIEDKLNNSYEFVRTVRFAVLGVFLVGPAVTTWYIILDKKLIRENSGSVARQALKKMLLDQLLFCPIFLCIMLSCLSVLQVGNTTEITNKLKTNVPSILTINYMVWPLVQLANFYFVPLNYRILVSQSASIFWNSFLAWKTNK